ncbi:MAG: hypothetical protein KatS3mg129_1197 [Leptospiraceae bacterium]|nr:MAG: hypothetical protein KatS3mg129_1197 [Leptospiraceae bacterium]
MEIQKNSFYKFALGILLLINCKTPVYKDTICYKINTIYKVLQSIEIDSNKWMLIVLDLNKRDYKNEIINDTKIQIAELKYNKFYIRDIKILKRDDYPLKPISIAYDKLSKTIYILNMAFYKQRSLEIYTLEKNILLFKTRYRSDNFNNLISIAYFNKKLIGLNSIDSLLNINPITFIIKDDLKFQYLTSKIKNAYKIKNINDSLFVIQPKEKKIIFLDKDFNINREIHFDLYPYDILFSNNQYVILLNKNYINILDSNTYQYLQNNESYFYFIPIPLLNTYHKFDIYNSSFEKYKIISQSYFDFFATNTKEKDWDIIINQFSSFSNRCNIHNDLDK